MGANIPDYHKQTRTRETQGYMTEASAAMLWKHPIFSGTAADRDRLPSVSVTGLNTAKGTGRSIRLSGTLKSDGTAHSVVVLDSVPGIHETYWQKPYVARIGEDGRFDVDLTEPAGKPGTLKLLFCFDNGAVTGDGKGYGISNTHNRNYRIAERSYQLAN
jgi:hypothetical protein